MKTARVLIYSIGVFFLIAVLIKVILPRIDLGINLGNDFSVTINNQSVYDIVSVETGIQSSDLGPEKVPQSTYKKIIKTGEEVTITPNLDAVESDIYINILTQLVIQQLRSFVIII